MLTEKEILAMRLHVGSQPYSEVLNLIDTIDELSAVLRYYANMKAVCGCADGGEKARIVLQEFEGGGK